MTPAEYCRTKVGQPGSSLYYRTLFLPTAKRNAMMALHAYFREVAGVVDECQEPAVARIKLEWWREEIRNAVSATPSHPVGKALQAVLAEYPLSPDTLLEFIDGIAMNLDHGRYQTFDGLGVYCERVGGTAALLDASVCGYADPATIPPIRQLGVAHALTRIVCDTGKDARRNRIYIPMEELARFDVPIADILNRREHEKLQSLIIHQIERVESFCERAIAKLPENDRPQQLPALITAALDRTLLQEIGNDGCRVLRQRTALPPLRKLWIAWNTRRRERRWHKSQQSKRA
jgi:phytoene synthase